MKNQILSRLDQIVSSLQGIEGKLSGSELTAAPAAIPADIQSVPAVSHGYEGHPDQVFGGSTYAQHGDDLVAINIFWNIGIRTPSYLDVGAHHPINISNTALLYKLGSRGINVEANPNLIERFRTERPEDINLNVGVSDQSGTMTFYMIDDFSGPNSFDKKTAEDFVAAYPEFSIRSTKEITVTTVNEIVATYCNGVFPDFLTIDIEGLDERILRSIDFKKHAPKVICAEVVSGSDTSNASSIANLLSEVGYFPHFKTIGNVFYVQEQFRSLLC